MKAIKAFLQAIDNNLVKILLAGFIFLVPLYPKLPIRTIDYTYIAIRIEDLYLVVLCVVFALQLIRRKVDLNRRFLILFLLFWFFVVISFLYGFYVQQTVVFPHLGFLHSVRRIEYMIVFFIASSVIKTKKDFWHLLTAVLMGLFLVNVYAVGQKFLGWPAVQTMNPEYAKGYFLFLTPEARISSTFAGHYDLASYIVFLIPIVIGLYLTTSSLRYFLLYLLSLLILAYTASRISFISYVVSITAFLLFLRKFRFFILVGLLSILILFTTKDLSNRFIKTLQVKKILVNERTGEVYIPQKITTKELPAGSFYIKINEKLSAKNKKEAAYVESYKEGILAEKILQASRSGTVLTSSQEAELLSTLSANIKPVQTIVSDISFATRLQIEWPRAINAFLSQPLLGTGPSSITEATDNDFLRWLGEFGLLATSTFIILLLSLFVFIARAATSLEKPKRIFFYAPLFSLAGLLMNATYIDVFEASKVAFTIWMVLGIFIGVLGLKKNHEK